MENGLSYNFVNCSLQDNKGFLWFGTLDGLNRFDGYTFKIYRNVPEKSRSLGNNFISALHQDKYGTIWVGTHNGLYAYNAITEDFTLVDKTRYEWVTRITSDSAGNLWIICAERLCRYNKAKNRFTVFDLKNIKPVAVACSKRNNIIWIVDHNGLLVHYDPSNKRFLAHDLFKHSAPSPSRHLVKVLETSSGDILIGTRHQGVKLFQTRTNTYRDLLSPERNGEIHVTDLIKKTDEEYWVSSTTGLYIYNLREDTYKHITKSYVDPNGLSDNYILSICADNEGGVWVGTKFGGVNYYNKQNTLFDRHLPTDRSNINGNIIQQISSGKPDKLWLGTEDDGLYQLNLKTGTVSRQPGIQRYKNIYGLLETGNELWIGKDEQGLDVIDRTTGKLLRHYQQGDSPEDLKSNFITCLYKTRNGHIYAGTSGGLYLFNSVTKKFKRVNELPETLFVSALIEDHEGNFWIGTYFSGVFFYSPSTGQSEHTELNFANSGRGNNTISSICEDEHHNIWFSSESGGIGRYQPRTHKLRRFTKKDGLPSDNTFKILLDNNKNLWVSTSNGLALLNTRSNSIKIYNSANGLLCDQFNYNSGFKANNGRLYFGSLKGLISFNPKEFNGRSFLRPLYITGLQVDNREVVVGDHSPLKKSIISTSELTLSYTQSTFSLDFAELSFIAPQSTEYMYKLNGFDKHWTYLKNNRRVYFTKLPPGEYVFEVKASKTGSDWNKVRKQMVIIVTPPWWSSKWAYVIYMGMAILSICYAIFFYHKKSEERNKRRFEVLNHEKDKEVYEAKIDFFTHVAHEIRTPLTLITAPLEKIELSFDLNEIKEHVKLVMRSTIRLLNLTNQLLDFRKAESNGFKLNFVKTEMKELLSNIYNDFALNARQHDIVYLLDLPSDVLYAFVDPEAMHKIIGNLIHNAIKFTSANVHVKMKDNDDYFCIEISSDGNIIGQQHKEKIFEPFYSLSNTKKNMGTGIGLALARSLAELHGGELVLQETDEQVNTFVLSVPKHQDIEFDFSAPAELTLSDHDAIIPKLESSVKSTVLLVDDNTEILEFLANDLNHRYNIFRAQNGQEAIDILNHQTVHLVISDVMMPVMDGLALCNYIKTMVELSHIPIILLTAKSSLESKVQGLETGADVYIEKPFSLAYINAQAASLLSNRLKIKTFFSENPLAGVHVIACSKADEQFLEKLNKAIVENIKDPNLDVAQLAGLMNISRRSLSRKIAGVSDLSPSEMISLTRLKHAAELILENNNRIYEVAELVGFRSRISFTRAFTRQFGLSPTEFIKNISKED